MLRSLLRRTLGVSGSLVALGAAVLLAPGCSTDGTDTALAEGAGGAASADETSGTVGAPPREDRPVVKTPVPTARPSGPEAPEFRVASLDPDTDAYALDDFEGQVLLIDFWATWCGPCKMAIPHLIELQEEYGDRGFSVLGVSVDRKGADHVRAFAERAGINYPMAMGNQEMAEAYGGAKGIQSIPLAFLVDRNGRVAQMIRGYQPKAALVRQIEPLLEQDG